MLKRGVVFLIFLILNIIIANACPPNCYDYEELECKAGCTDFTGATGADLIEYGTTYDLSTSQLNSMTPYQLSEFYSNLGMAQKYPDNFKQYCKDHTCTDTQLSYVDSISITD